MIPHDCGITTNNGNLSFDYRTSFHTARKFNYRDARPSSLHFLVTQERSLKRSTYLPAGIRLIAAQLLGDDGAPGLLLASCLVDFFYFFPNEALRSFIGEIVATVAPYGLPLLAQEIDGLRTSLTNLAEAIAPARVGLCFGESVGAVAAVHHFLIENSRGPVWVYGIAFVRDVDTVSTIAPHLTTNDIE